LAAGFPQQFNVSYENVLCGKPHLKAGSLNIMVGNPGQQPYRVLEQLSAATVHDHHEFRQRRVIAQQSY